MQKFIHAANLDVFFLNCSYVIFLKNIYFCLKLLFTLDSIIMNSRWRKQIQINLLLFPSLRRNSPEVPFPPSCLLWEEEGRRGGKLFGKAIPALQSQMGQVLFPKTKLPTPLLTPNLVCIMHSLEKMDTSVNRGGGNNPDYINLRLFAELVHTLCKIFNYSNKFSQRTYCLDGMSVNSKLIRFFCQLLIR